MGTVSAALRARAERGRRAACPADRFRLAADVGPALVGRIEWDPESDGRVPLVVIDGQAFSWEEVGRMLITFEGLTLEARIKDTIELVGNLPSV